MTDSEEAQLGVIIVTYNSAGVIGGCLASLLAVRKPPLRIVVVDNASSDGSARIVERSASIRGPHRVELIRAQANRGFASGVNLGLAHLSADPAIGYFWILNPDCVVPDDTPATYLAALKAAGPFALMGGRTLYAATRPAIQSEGGRIGRWTGVCRLTNRGCDPATARSPAEETLDFISGANMIASRAFLDRAGPMAEDYFLYYEEVDWAVRRGDLPLRLCPDAIVHHHAGTSIGSATLENGATAFASYFNHRARMRFLWRHRARALPTALAFALLRAAMLAIRGERGEAIGALRGTLGLAPPPEVAARLIHEGASRTARSGGRTATIRP